MKRNNELYHYAAFTKSELGSKVINYKKKHLDIQITRKVFEQICRDEV